MGVIHSVPDSLFISIGGENQPRTMLSRLLCHLLPGQDAAKRSKIRIPVL